MQSLAQSTALFRIGTRGSPLALVQARTVRARLASALGAGEDEIELVIIRTSGDTIQDRPLAEVGGKGLFTKEIEEALLGGRIDLAVHSAKDMPTLSQPGLMLAACLEREDPRDVFLSPKAASLADLPQGATLGTASLRRQAIAKRARPDLKVVPLRGNVETRLRKLDAGEVDATLLALAGMKRLGLTQHVTRIMSVDEFLPAVAQGAIGIEARADDARTHEALARINHRRDFDRGRLRARLPRRARRLLQDADRRPCHARRRCIALPRLDRASRWRGRARHRRHRAHEGCGDHRRRSRTRLEGARRRPDSSSD